MAKYPYYCYISCNNLSLIGTQCALQGAHPTIQIDSQF